MMNKATTAKLLKACKATLDCLEHLTTDKFSKGGDADIRRMLKQVIEQAEK